MAKKRYIDTKFWSDSYITELDPLERYLFLYFISNEHTNLCGVYEIPMRIMSFETGIDTDALKKMLDRFERDKKVFYKDGWIVIKNYIKNQVLNPSIIEGIQRELDCVPPVLKLLINTLSPHSDPTLTPDKLGKVKSSKVRYSKSDFEKFWAVYPRKVSKKNAEKAFARVNPEPSKLKLMIAAVVQQAKSPQWTKDEGQFIPHPTTWLNQERWQDEIKAGSAASIKYSSVKSTKV